MISDDSAQLPPEHHPFSFPDLPLDLGDLFGCRMVGACWRLIAAPGVSLLAIRGQGVVAPLSAAPLAPLLLALVRNSVLLLGLLGVVAHSERFHSLLQGCALGLAVKLRAE